MDFKAESVSEAVAEKRAETGICDEAASDPIDIRTTCSRADGGDRGLLGSQNSFIDFFDLFCWFFRYEDSCQVAAVALGADGAPVDEQDGMFVEFSVSGVGVGECGGRSDSDDGFEGGALPAEVAHGGFEEEADVRFGLSGAEAASDDSDSAFSDLDGFANLCQFRAIFDFAKPFDDSGGGYEGC